jgi:GNAT superfamily N-acetyltransferase|tara:strand:+ start:178 stop:645 length:468 start_codon:yes stop_codon:yes gene_type:complete
MVLRLIVPADAALLREIYADAIESQASELYSDQQVKSWAALAWLPGVLDQTLMEGSGWISGGDAAFAIRYPPDRLALLYCRGRAARQGHGKALLDRIEADAIADGVTCLRTEASQFSRPLFARRGWRLVAPEIITIAGVPFERYRMHKALGKLRS